ncbi:hypothetical protein GCM10023324_67520 [Streptomyces youssoufiensis]
MHKICPLLARLAGRVARTRPSAAMCTHQASGSPLPLTTHLARAGPVPRGIGMRLRRVGRRTPRNTPTSLGEVRIRQKWGVP